MIQRQQTLWLILAIVAGIMSFKFPFLTGVKLENNLPTAAILDAGSNFFTLILTGACIIIAAVTIFMFKDRKTQAMLALVGLLLSVGLLILYFMQMKNFQSSTLALWCILPVAILVGFFMGYRGIRHDQKLVKSLDKLR